jgi:hypothetical protein
MELVDPEIVEAFGLQRPLQQGHPGCVLDLALAYQLSHDLLQRALRRPQPSISTNASPAQDRTQATAPTPPPSAQADLGQVPLDPETIHHLHITLRALPRPLLESLARAFRKRFQVPEEAVTIADRINQKCHHDWIETFLVQHQLQSG